MTPSPDSEGLGGTQVLVTGATGFLGAGLVRRLTAAGARVAVLARSSLAGGRLADLEDTVTLLQGDLRSLPPRPPASWPVPRIIFHLGACGVDPADADPTRLVDTNVRGTASMLQYAAMWKVGRFIHFGSSVEYGSCQAAAEDSPIEPRSEYGATKAASSLLVQAAARQIGLPGIVLRPYSVYGAGEEPHRLVSFLIQRALRNLPIEFTDGRQTRDFVHVDDVIEAALAVVRHRLAPGETLNICTGIETPVREVVSRIVDLTASASEVHFGSRPHRQDELWHSSGSPESALRRLGWAPRITLDAGLESTLTSLRNQGRTEGNHG